MTGPIYVLSTMHIAHRTFLCTVDIFSFSSIGVG